jgi:hypothetical protein
MIILLGFPKSGTSSFQKLFTDLGYISYHHIINNQYIGTIIKNNKINNKLVLSNFNKNDVITQMDVCINKNNAYWPQLIDYKQLYYENMDAIFILNKRDPHNLLSSFKRWNSLDKRLFEYNPELVRNNTDEELIELFNNHYKNIEDIFYLQSDSKFIIFDIENDNIDKLKIYIDLKEIKEFPKENVNLKQLI